MSVYLKDDLVLLDSDLVATSEDCCCGEECCPFFDTYSTVTLEGQVIGCDDGTISLPSKSWTKVASGGGCDVDTFQFAVDLNCSCQFNAQNCFPFTEVDYVEVDDIGDCDDPDSYSGCVILAHISCDGTAVLEGSTSTICCDGHSGAILNPTSPYDISSGSLDETIPSDTDGSISFRFILTLA